MYKKLTLVIFISLIALCVPFASESIADYGDTLWTEDGEEICTAGSDQESPKIISDGSNGAIVIWKDRRNGMPDIYAQMVDANGNILEDEIPVCTDKEYQSNQQLVSDGSGGAIITWHDNRFDENFDIYAQKVDSNGNVSLQADGMIICDANLGQEEPQLVSDGSGGAIITWQDHRNNHDDIYAQRMDAKGELKWDAGGGDYSGIRLCTGNYDEKYPQITSDGSGGAIIVWELWIPGPPIGIANKDLYAQRVDANGNVLWGANGVAICTLDGHQKSPQIISDGSKGAIIVWEGGDIYAQRVDENGNLHPQWAVNGVAICTEDGDQKFPQLISDGDGGAIITWQDSRDGNSDIYAQMVDSNGTVQWIDDGEKVCKVENTQSYPQLVSDGSGGAIITWQDDRGGNYPDIYAQLIDLKGEPQWTENGIAVCTASYHQRYPQITSDGSGGAIITWSDRRNGSDFNIYAQNVTTIINNTGLPVVTTEGIGSITDTTAVCGGIVKDDDGAAVTARGACWSTLQNPTIADSKTIDGAGLGGFTSNISGLNPKTKYYVRTYATNANGTSYGSEVSFTTGSIPDVTTAQVSSITDTTAVCGGDVTGDGGAAVTARGVCWSTSQNPTIADSKTTDGSGLGSFTSNITGLSAETKYYVRAYATNAWGTGYGDNRSFTTKNIPAVVTEVVSSITEISAVCGGDVIDDGDAAVTARGVCWSTSVNPTIADSKTSNGVGLGIFTSNITGLSPNVTYYVRAYATNSEGTGYGNNRSFTTDKIPNLASSATVTASSSFSPDFSPDKANDGIYGAWDAYEWASDGEMKPSIKFTWGKAQTVNKVVLYDRCNPFDQIYDAWMYLKKNGSTVKSIHLGMFPFGGAAKEVIFDPVSIDEILLDIVDGEGLNVGLSEMLVYYDSTLKTKENLASSATVTASSYHSEGFKPDKANDGIYGAWDAYEWASDGDMTPWIKFTWSKAQTVNKVVFYDRCNPFDQIYDAWMYLKKNGSTVKSIHLGMFPFGGAAKEIIFDAVSVDEIYLDIVDGDGLNVGLSEMEVYYDTTVGTEENLASSATVKASSYFSSDFSSDKANDGIYGAWDAYEWASDGDMTPSINFKLSKAQTVNKVVLYDRCNPIDQIYDAWMYLRKNGSTVKSIHLGMFPYGGAAKEVIFDPVSIDEIYLDIVDGGGLNIGLSEVKVYND